MKLYEESMPASIGNAIYQYGDNSITKIIQYLEVDDEHGYILTPDAFYYAFKTKGSFLLKDLTDVMIRKVRHQEKELILVADGIHHMFYAHDFDFGDLLDALEDQKAFTITYPMALDDRILYLSDVILHDIDDDVYEDTTLNDLQKEQLNSYLETVKNAESLDDTHFHIEMELLVDHVMDLCNALELDSEEIDALAQAQEEMNQQEDQMFDSFKDMYAQNKDKIKDVTGIDMDDLQNKSPEELNSMVDDLCTRFNISKDQLTELASRFASKHK